MSDQDLTPSIVELARAGHDLFPRAHADLSLLSDLLKKNAGPDGEAPSHQGTLTGRQAQPFKFDAAVSLKQFNPHHSACVDAKVICTVGLGQEQEKVDDILDPLCQVSWHHLKLQVAEDLETTGNGYIEVIRENPKEANSKIIGLHWMPARDVWIHIENYRYQMHYEILNRGSASPNGHGTVDRAFAKFGDAFGPQGFFDRHKNANPEVTSELIHFMEPGVGSRYYGIPKWLAATAYVELAQSMVQHQFDFHNNRGVPEFMLFLLGAKLPKKDWEKIENSLKAQIGLGNKHKSVALNLPNREMVVQLEKLALDSAGDGEMFRNMQESLAMSIISAHRVPPSLAQILIPGKMGAANEMSNAVISFQGLVVGPKQVTFETVLGCTLGDPLLNGGLDLGKRDFNLVTVVDEMAEALEKLKPADTMGRMRDGMGEAAQEGRDLEDGLEKRKVQLLEKVEDGGWTREDVSDFLSITLDRMARTPA